MIHPPRPPEKDNNKIGEPFFIAVESICWIVVRLFQPKIMADRVETHTHTQAYVPAEGGGEDAELVLLAVDARGVGVDVDEVIGRAAGHGGSRRRCDGEEDEDERDGRRMLHGKGYGSWFSRIRDVFSGRQKL